MTVVAVTKGFGAAAVEAALAAGLADVGENYAAELTGKAALAGDLAVRWHFLGAVQRNKVKALAPHVALWQGVDRAAAAEEIAKRTPGAAVLVQVNVSEEPQKAGCDWSDAPAVVGVCRAEGLHVRGLMAVGPAGPPELSRQPFRRLAGLAAELALAELSMGMTDDVEVAVEEGSTMLRLGRALFGPRPGPAQARR